ncbi:MAG TPA: hypothetical protein VG101_08580 [Puia sp.]|jgi:hypothetical protein|nr:hypothetical protein [Puia sp.]
MSRYFVLFLFCGLMGFAVRSDAQSAVRPDAQSILRTKWRTYYLPITDTITVSFGSDSMAVTTSKGAALLQSRFKLANDVLTLQDYGGANMCADLAGTYQVRISADTLILVMDRDQCEARGGTLMAKRWVRVAAPPAAPASKKRKAG